MNDIKRGKALLSVLNDIWDDFENAEVREGIYPDGRRKYEIWTYPDEKEDD